MSRRKGKGGIFKYLTPSRIPLPELETVVPASTAASVQKEVTSILQGQTSMDSMLRGAYSRVNSEDKSRIAKYAVENDVTATIRLSKKISEFATTELKESTVREWKNAFVQERNTRK
jgi:hypothetical protein